MIPLVMSAFTKAQQAGPDLAKLKKSTDGFETNFVKQLVSEMRKSSKSEFGDVPGSAIYDDMMNEAIAGQVAAGGRFGVSNSMYKQLSQLVFNEMNQTNNGTKS